MLQIGLFIVQNETRTQSHYRFATASIFRSCWCINKVIMKPLFGILNFKRNLAEFSLQLKIKNFHDTTQLSIDYLPLNFLRAATNYLPCSHTGKHAKRSVLLYSRLLFFSVRPYLAFSVEPTIAVNLFTRSIFVATNISCRAACCQPFSTSSPDIQLSV